MNLTNLFLLFRRLLAFLYDSFLLLALFFAVTAVALFLNNGQAIETWLYKLTLLPIAGLFYVWFWKNGGQTLGMRAWRIKLVNSKSGLVSYKQCVLRFVLGVCTFGITYLYILFNNNRYALHDVLSKTYIEKENNIKKQ